MVPKWICKKCRDRGVHWFLPQNRKCRRCGEVVEFVTEAEWENRKAEPAAKRQRVLELRDS